MQHHGHVPRAPPHMRAHHMAALAAGNSAAAQQPPPPPHMPGALGMGATPAPSQLQNQLHAKVTVTSAAQKPAPAHHINNSSLSAATPTSAAPPQQQHLREHHNRLNHQQHISHTVPTTQMQKIRQQHQHLNNNNNNGNNKNSNHHNHHQHHQQHHNSNNNNNQQTYNHVNLSMRPPHQPHQRNMPHHVQQQQQPPPPLPHHHNQQQPPVMVAHMKNHLPPHVHGHKQQHILQPIQQNHYYNNNNNNSKAKYNNNNNNNTGTNAPNYVAPKTILQNPYRTLKAKTALPTTGTHEVNPETSPCGETTASVPADGVANASSAGVENDENDSSVGNGPLMDVEDASSGHELSMPIASDGSSKAITLSNVDTGVMKHSKEKTPMCLVNELARFNKITHQYRLTGEKGPAHCKRFTVTLKLGEEEYSAEGFKIKKAQHLAATEAIEKTRYTHPVPKMNRRLDEIVAARTNITPTVELNALAMKLGQQTYYLFDPRQLQPADVLPPPADAFVSPYHNAPQLIGGHHHMVAPPPLPHPAYMRRHGPLAAYMPGVLPHARYGHHRGGYAPKYHHRFTLPPPHGHGNIGPTRSFISSHMPCKITLIVGKQKFVGSGRTLQQAKHDAAARALQVLKTQATNELNELLNHSLEDSDSKSPISLVHEIGIKRNLTVHFKVLREEGPAHMRNFITACIVGTIVTEGEGNGKKISKKRAAEKMLDELKKLPPLTPTKSPVKRIKVRTPSKAMSSANATPNKNGPVERRKRPGASIREKPEGEVEEENPITKLLQMQQNKKEKEPVFELIAKNGNENCRRREFIMEVTANGMVARGTGPSKKLAKRNAAQNLLLAMGVDDASEPTRTNVANQNEAKVSVNGSAAVEQQTAGSPNASNAVSAIEVAAAAEAPPTATTTTTTKTTTPAPTQAAAELPLVSTPVGQLPGILIVRQHKRHAAKKKEASVVISTPSTPSAADSKKEEPAAAVSASTAPTAPAESNSTPSSTATTATTTTDATAVATDSSTAATTAEATASPRTTIATTVATVESNDASSTKTPSSGSGSGTSTAAGAHMKEQLLYLAKLFRFEVNFSDYPQGNHNEFLTIVMLSTDPPQICHGMGMSSEESQNDAAKNALKILSELGLNIAKK